MNKQELLRYIGFTEYEVRTLITLTNLKIATTKEISFDSHVPQNKLYAILEKFKLLGILETIPDITKKFKLVNLNYYIRTKVKEKEEKLKELKEGVSKFNDLTDVDETSIFSLIKGQKTVMNKMAEANVRVKKEVIGVQRNWKLWGEGLKVMKDSVKKGVDVKFIGEINSETKKRATEWKKIGCKIRSFNKKFGEYPLRFTIFDNEEARITIGKPEIQDPKDYITIWTKSKPLIRILRTQFMNMWEEGEKF